MLDAVKVHNSDVENDNGIKENEMLEMLASGMKSYFLHHSRL